MRPLDRRVAAFELDLQERLATRIEPCEFGTAFLNDAFPLKWDSNFLWVRSPLESLTAVALALDADQVFGTAGLVHRKVVVDDVEQGSRLAPGFESLGYEAERLVRMVHRRDPDRWPDRWNDEAAAEIDLGTFRPFLIEAFREADEGRYADHAEMLADFRHVLVERGGARFFVGRTDGEIAAGCELYELGDVAQIEDVYTLERFRGRGLARAVVLVAARAARVAGCEVVFLNADDGDWPKLLYEKLGFDEIGRFWSFVKPGDAIGVLQGRA